MSRNTNDSRNSTYPNAKFNLLPFHFHLVYLLVLGFNPRAEDELQALTRKSTPMVALLSSSGSHCSSEKRRRRLDLPTDEFPIRRSLTLTGCWTFDEDETGGIWTGEKVVKMELPSSHLDAVWLCLPEVPDRLSYLISGEMFALLVYFLISFSHKSCPVMLPVQEPKCTD